MSWSPIKVTKYGDILSTPNGREIRDADQLVLGGHVGQHGACGGEFHLMRSSGSHHALLCSKCMLREPVSVDVDSYGKLRAWSEMTFNGGPTPSDGEG